MATFAKIKMMSEDVNSRLLTGKFKANGQLARVEDGAIVVVGDLMDSTVYANNKDMNVFEIGAPAADTDEVAIVDIVDVSKGDVYGQAWREGVRTDSLFAEPGQPVRVRILKKYDRFELSADGFKSEPTVGKYAVIEASGTKLVPSEEAPAAGKFGVKIEMAKDFVIGQTVAGKKYYCRVL